MKDQDNFEQALKQRYQMEKAQTTLPSKIKHRMLMHQAKQTEASYSVFSWLSGISAVAVCALVIGLIYLQKLSVQHQVPQGLLVQVHHLDSELFDSSEPETELAKTYSQMQLENAKIRQHHKQQQGQLLATVNGWSLKTCENQMLEITPALVKKFQQWNRVDEHLNAGSYVQIRFDQQGRIQEIVEATNSLTC